jgi:hypothetical protein
MDRIGTSPVALIERKVARETSDYIPVIQRKEQARSPMHSKTCKFQVSSQIETKTAALGKQVL